MTVGPRTQGAKALLLVLNPERLPRGGLLWGDLRCGFQLAGQAQGRDVPSARGSSLCLQPGGVCWTRGLSLGNGGGRCRHRDIPLSRTRCRAQTWCRQLWGGHKVDEGPGSRSWRVPSAQLVLSGTAAWAGGISVSPQGLLKALELCWVWLHLFLIHHSAEYPLYF